jgi:glycosyltransferase involved in cell wall biosynthesis
VNIHLLAIFGKDVNSSPLAVALRKQNITLTTFSDAIRLNYPQKYMRVFVGLPRLLWFSFVTAIRSLRSKPRADAVIVNSHFDLLAFGLVGWFVRGALPKLVLRGFIYTETGSSMLASLKHRYYRMVLRNADIIVCHSQLEIENNNRLFPDCAGRFVFYPYAMHVAGATGFVDATIERKTIVSAGRSGRDYALLAKAAADIDADVNIICDQFPQALRGELPANVRVLSNCYRDCYFEQLVDCRFVVVPLQVDDISAGQMVLIQAMALGKPTVITRTATTADYIYDGGIISVPLNDLSAMTEALQRLSRDDALCTRLGREAAEAYKKKYSIDAYAAHLVESARLAVEGPGGRSA